MVMSPPLMVMMLSHFMPLPPEPVEVSVRVPPSMVILRSALMPQAALVSWSSVSHMPLPLVVTLMTGSPLMKISPIQVNPLAAIAAQLTVILPPSM